MKRVEFDPETIRDACLIGAVNIALRHAASGRWKQTRLLFADRIAAAIDSRKLVAADERRLLGKEFESPPSSKFL